MTVEVAKKILRGEQYNMPPGGEDGKTLVRLAQKLGPHGGPDWFASLADAELAPIVAAIGGLSRPLDPLGHLDAFREAARAMVEQKLTERMVAKMEDLERVSTKLARGALWLAAAGVLFAAVQIVIAIGNAE